MTAASSNESTLRHSTRNDSITNSTEEDADDDDADDADEDNDDDADDDEADDDEGGGMRAEFESAAAIVVWTAANEEPMSTVPFAMFSLAEVKQKQIQNKSKKTLQTSIAMMVGGFSAPYMNSKSRKSVALQVQKRKQTQSMR